MKKLLSILSLLVITFSINFDTNAAVTTALASGSWSSSFTWSNGIPSCGDTIIIPANKIVRITESVNLDVPGDLLCMAVRIYIYGSLRFDNGRKLSLSKGACISVSTGGTISPSAKGGGSSECIYFGQTKEWQSSEGNIIGPESIGCAIELPVDLISFEAKQIRNNLWNFEWQIANETDVSNYIILFSEDGLDWKQIKSIEIILSDLNFKTYNENIEISNQENNFYVRLCNKDINGKIKILATKYLMNNNIQNNTQIFPNPQQQGKSITLLLNLNNKNEQTSIKIIDYTGKIIYFDSTINSEQNIEIPSNNFQKGSYVIEIIRGSETDFKKFILI